MSSVLSDKRVLVFDRGGLFTHVAYQLGKYTDDPVLYFSEWREAFPKSIRRMPGVGVPNVQRVDDFFTEIGASDLIVFTDIGDGSLQTHLRNQGHLVWGSGEADRFETDKIFFNLWLAGSELPSAEMYLIEGLDALREFLQDPQHDDMWLKANDRGDLETYHHVSWELSRRFFESLAYHIGPNGDILRIIAQRPILSKAELGYDGYMIDGEVPEYGVYGFEAKDAAYLGKFTDVLPPGLKMVNDMMGEQYRDLGYRGAYHTEVREGKDGASYFIDPTNRFGYPPSAVLMGWYKNWDDIIYYGAAGQVVEPEPIHDKALWGSEIILTVEESDFFRPVIFDEKLRDNVAITWHCRVNEVDYSAGNGETQVGSVFAYGSTPREAADAAQAIAKNVQADGLSYNVGSLKQLLAVVDKYESKHEVVDNA